MIRIKGVEQERQDLRLSAFTAFLLGAGGDKAPSFGEFLQKIGLSDKPAEEDTHYKKDLSKDDILAQAAKAKEAINKAKGKK